MRARLGRSTWCWCGASTGKDVRLKPRPNQGCGDAGTAPPGIGNTVYGLYRRVTCKGRGSCADLRRQDKPQSCNSNSPKLLVPLVCSLLFLVCLPCLCAQNPFVSWYQEAELTNPHVENKGNFGDSVALSGNIAVVGACCLDETVNGNPYQGAAHVFVKSGGTWTQQAELTAGDGAANDFFGNSVSVSGNTILSWSLLQNHVGSNAQQGAAYILVENNGTWSQQAELTAADGTASGWFGYPVSLSGNTAVVEALVFLFRLWRGLCLHRKRRNLDPASQVDPPAPQRRRLLQTSGFDQWQHHRGWGRCELWGGRSLCLH